MKRILVTGSEGFIGKNLLHALRRQSSHQIQGFDIHDPVSDLEKYVEAADVIFHLAGVNRPEKEEEFLTGNSGLTDRIIEVICRGKRRPLLVLSSSIQALLDNPYGRSKLLAEKAIENYATTGGNGIVFRLPNVFGKWSRPNYNSAVATFCYNIARDLPITVSDPKRTLELVYVDDVVREFLSVLDDTSLSGFRQGEVRPVYTIELGELVKEIQAFKETRTTLRLPDLDNSFRKALLATYTSFLPDKGLCYSLAKKTDERGSLAELLKSPHFGQIFVSRTKPGITRGNHWHDTKVEKFCVVEGDAVIRFRHVDNGRVISYPVRGAEFQVVDIPPGYTHSIENVGKGELVVLFWSSEPFDQARPDTYASMVLPSKD